MSTVFTIMAAMEPGPVEFQIHQVVSAFQVIIDKAHQPTKAHFRGCCCASRKSGMSAMNIKKVVGNGGHAAASNIPDANDKMRGCIFFKMSKNELEKCTERFSKITYLFISPNLSPSLHLSISPNHFLL